ncbi:MAG: GAF domain-containing protein [Magnetococcales bacterium]|nr:GAF domain-containing protein [Magnetococcales bacterium]
MPDSTPQNQTKRSMRRGIGRTLFFWFLAIALIPLGVISWTSYEKARLSLRQEAVKLLSTTLSLKKSHFQGFFNQRLRHLEAQSLSRTNLHFLQALQRAHDQVGPDGKAFVESFQWAVLVEEHGVDLEEFQHTYGLANLYLIDQDGHILYTAQETPLLGQNVLQGSLKKSLLGKIVERAMGTDQAVFSDLGHFPPATDNIAAFLARAILDEEGNNAGVLVIPLAPKKMFRIFEDRIGLGMSGETYLVGRDQLMRSNSRFDTRTTVLKQKVDTPIIQTWLHHEAEHHADFSHHSTEMTYTSVTESGRTNDLIEKVGKSGWWLKKIYPDYRGVDVLGFQVNLDFLEPFGIHWVLIAELDADEFYAPSIALGREILVTLFVTILLVFLIARFVSGHIVNPLLILTHRANRIAKGEMKWPAFLSPNNELGSLAKALEEMTHSLSESARRDAQDNWMKVSAGLLGECLRGEQSLEKLAQNIIGFLTPRLNAITGAIYLLEKSGRLRFAGGFAYKAEHIQQTIALGEGLLGHVAKRGEHQIIHQIPPDYLPVHSGLGEMEPSHLLLYPFLLNGQVEAVIELGSFQEFQAIHLELLDHEAEAITMAIKAAQSRTEMQQMLAQSREQADILKQNSEEARLSNEKLQEQTQALQNSETLLQQQQEELRVSNEELEEQTQLLTEQKQEAQRKNSELERAQRELVVKARDLEVAGHFRSEFLTSMSEELRAPLNGILVLTRGFSANKGGNLSPTDLDNAHAVHAHGLELLEMINGILDLAKIEAGQVDVHGELLEILEISNRLEQKFSRIAKKIGADFSLYHSDDLPDTLRTDYGKLEQIVKHLLARAFKVVGEGTVTLSFQPLPMGWVIESGGVSNNQGIVLVISDTLSDTSQQRTEGLLETLRESSSTVDKPFGKTGLGLAISNQLAQLLGGELRIESREGQGCAFTLFLPNLPWGMGDSPPPKSPEPPASPDKSFKLPPPVQLPGALDNTQPKSTKPVSVEDTASADKIASAMTSDSATLVNTSAPAESVAASSSEESSGSVVSIPAKELVAPAASSADLAASEESTASTEPTASVESAGAVQPGISQPASPDLIEAVADSTPHRPDPVILVVDSDVRTIYETVRLLEVAGYTAYMAANGEKALEQLGKYPSVNLVLVGLSPESDRALQVIGKIKDHPGAGDAPLRVVALVPVGEKADQKAACLAAGVIGVVEKPLDIPLFSKTISDWFKVSS